METPREAAEYVRTIRSAGKKSYAIAYLNYKANGAPQPNAVWHNVGCMGAQAVRSRLDGIFDRAGE